MKHSQNPNPSSFFAGSIPDFDQSKCKKCAKRLKHFGHFLDVKTSVCLLTETLAKSHWCRLVKDIWEQPKNWGHGVAITDQIMGISRLLGDTCPGCSPSHRLFQELCISRTNVFTVNKRILTQVH